MSVSLICPSCGTPTTFYRAPVSLCPQCQTALPESLRQSAEGALTREKVGRPLLLTVGMYVAPAFSGFFLLLVILAPFNAARYTVNGEAVTGMEFLRGGGLIFGLGSAAALAAAYAIWRERSWSRWAMVGFWTAQLAGGIGVGWADSGLSGAARAVASLLPVVILAWWYLFEKENVVEYYRALEKLETAEAARRGPKMSDGA